MFAIVCNGVTNIWKLGFNREILRSTQLTTQLINVSIINDKRVVESEIMVFFDVVSVFTNLMIENNSSST